MKKIWLFVWRMNPPHLWHKKIIDKSLDENDKTIVFLWSTNISDENNPFLFSGRKNILEEYYKKELEQEIFHIFWIDDHIDDKIWLSNILKQLSLLFESGEIEINIYWWDFKNDSAIKVFKEHISLFNNPRMNFIEIDRNVLDISSTKIREHIKKWEKKMIEEMMWEDFYKTFKKLKNANY